MPVMEIQAENIQAESNTVGAPSCGHPVYQVVPACREFVVQPLQSPGEAPEDVLDVPELRGAPVLDAVWELLH